MNVVYCDIDEANVNLDQLQDLIYKRQPKAALIVHNFGTVVDVSKISAFAKQRGCRLIETLLPPLQWAKSTVTSRITQ